MFRCPGFATTPAGFSRSVRCLYPLTAPCDSRETARADPHEETVPYVMKKTVPYEQASLLFANGNDSAEEQARKAAARKEQDSSTPRELEWACLRLLNSLSHWGCSTKRRAVACALSGVVLASIMVALAATSLGQALAKSVTSSARNAVINPARRQRQRQRLR